LACSSLLSVDWLRLRASPLAEELMEPPRLLPLPGREPEDSPPEADAAAAARSRRLPEREPDFEAASSRDAPAEVRREMLDLSADAERPRTPALSEAVDARRAASVDGLERSKSSFTMPHETNFTRTLKILL
jgi:hypothetical protein